MKLPLRCIYLTSILFAGCASPPPESDAGSACTSANNFCADASSSNPADGSVLADAGAGPDAGAVTDAGASTDGGVLGDAGAAPDAGVMPADAGPGADGGLPLCLWDQSNWDNCFWQ